MFLQTKNALLQKIEAQITAKVPPKMQKSYARVINLGMNIMHSPQTHHLMVEQMNAPGDPANNAGEGVAKLIGMLYHKSKGTMPLQAAIPAAQVLLCDALDFMATSGRLTISNDTVAQATQSMVTYILQLFGVTQDKLQGMMQQAIAKQGGAAQGNPVATKPAGGILGQAQGAQ